jgi:hypothetical protein
LNAITSDSCEAQVTTEGSISISEVRIPVAALKAQPIEVRHTYYLLGHMFNELISLQKMIGFALPKHDDPSCFRRGAEVAQVMLLFRVACSKVYEACDSLKTPAVSDVLSRLVLNELVDGEVRLAEMKALPQSNPWLARLRNRAGFHFPKLNQWRAEIEPDDSWEDDLIYVGEKTGNTFYAAADNVLQGLVFGLHTPGAPRKAVDEMVAEMIGLLRSMNDFLEKALGVLVDVVILQRRGIATQVGSLIAPDYQTTFIPYWTQIRDRADDETNQD